MSLVNEVYLKQVMDNVNVILGKWPTIVSISPLPISGDTGHDKMIGYGVPFSHEVYDVQVKEPEL
eukprot:6131022-Karenia_brevis.AAC.1